MFPFGGGPNVRVGRARARMDQMDCADIMLKAVERKRSRSIARRESFSGTEDDLKKFREAVESNDKDSSLQKDIDEYAIKVRELRGTKETPEKPIETPKDKKVSVVPKTEEKPNKTSILNDKVENTCHQIHVDPADQINAAGDISSVGTKESKASTNDDDGKTITEDNSDIVSGDSGICDKNVNNPENITPLLNEKNKVESFSTVETIEFNNEEHTELECNEVIDKESASFTNTDDYMEKQCDTQEQVKILEAEDELQLGIEVEVQSEKEVEFQTEKEIEVQSEREIEVQSEKEVAVQSEEEPEVQSEKDDEVQSEKEGEVQSEREIEFQLEEEIENQSDNEIDVQSEKEIDVHSKKETEVTSDREREVQSEKEIDVQLEKEIEVQSEREIEVQSEKEIEVQSEREFEVHLEKEIKVQSEANKQVQLEAAIEFENVVSTQEPVQENNFLSIVDRIKNDITTLKTLSKTSSNIPGMNLEPEEPKDQKVSISQKQYEAETSSSSKIEIDDQQKRTEHKQTGIKVALDRVYREKSVGEIQVPKELSSHLMSLSSANISEELRKSCSNIVARSMDMEMSKEYLLKRLGDLLSQEKEQLTNDLLRRKEQLQDTRSSQAQEIKCLDKRHKEELKIIRNSHAQRFAELECNYLDHVENLKKEIELLENEKDNMGRPVDLMSNYLHADPGKPSQLTELESELECCSCGHICKPPCKIFQCPEGDLLCQTCKDRIGQDTLCPRCQCGLFGQVSRNKGLEKIATKYFQ